MFEAEIVVKMAGVVPLNAEETTRRRVMGGRLSGRGLGSLFEVAFARVFFQAHVRRDRLSFLRLTMGFTIVEKGLA